MSQKELDRVRALPCSKCGHPPRSDAHHLTGAGMGLKASDKTTIPLCRSCHMAWHCGNGVFAGTTATERKAWHVAQLKALEGVF
jgi:hypothetical protein